MRRLDPPPPAFGGLLWELGITCPPRRPGDDGDGYADWLRELRGCPHAELPTRPETEEDLRRRAVAIAEGRQWEAARDRLIDRGALRATTPYYEAEAMIAAAREEVTP
ncbi:MAG TPA: hypothetical protein DCQ64_04885 [Candidatus Rokubacteria bacterium]|nr:hypothetical protein [Candidatus Rokubacteria bacterium]